MKIGINGRFLVAKQTGVQRAAYNLVKTLVEVDQENQYVLFTGRSQLNNSDWDGGNVKVVASNLQGGENFKNHYWEQITLPRLCRKYNIDILHSPANMAPLFYRGKSIVHIHDLCFVVNPQWYSFPFHTVYNLIVPRLARRATKVITNSNNSRNDLLQFCKVDADKVSLIYWAVDTHFLTGEKQPPTKELQAGQYILYVGSLEPRKNISTLVKAFEQLRSADSTLKPKLVLIGGESPLFADMRVKIQKFHDDVIFKGFVDDEELKDYYRGAAVVAYPSLYEGFGLPPLEAMASAVPVVTSNTSSLPEVVGDAALMVDPYDVDELASTLARVLKDADLREDLSRRGLERVKRFNWYRVARNILGIYYEVYHESQGVEGSSRYLPADMWNRLIMMEKAKLEQSPT